MKPAPTMTYEDAVRFTARRPLTNDDLLRAAIATPSSYGASRLHWWHRHRVIQAAAPLEQAYHEVTKGHATVKGGV